jgi:hypothetical protein
VKNWSRIPQPEWPRLTHIGTFVYFEASVPCSLRESAQGLSSTAMFLCAQEAMSGMSRTVSVSSLVGGIVLVVLNGT